MTPETVAFLQQLALEHGGLALKGEDGGFFAESRLTPLARREGCESVDALVDRLRQEADPQLAGGAVEALAVTDTAFFRDGASFEALGREVLGRLAARTDRAVQVWSAGCSTGQEAYSLAILAAEHDPAVRLEIIATDLSQRVLGKAHSGLYTQFEVQRGLPVRLLLKYFDKAGEMWAISPRLKADIRWRRLNLAEDRRSVRRFDLVLCRHVLEYLEPRTRSSVLDRLTNALAQDGFLALGPQDAAPAGFERVGAGLFRRVGTAACADAAGQRASA